MIKYAIFLLVLLCAGTKLRASDTIPTPFILKKAELSSGAERKNWREYHSGEGRFRILTPGDMQHKVDSIATAVGVLAYHTFFFQPMEKDADNLIYMLGYCDYPAGTVHSDSTELLPDFFAATVESAVEAVDGKLIYAGNYRHKKYPGKIWRIEYLEGGALIKTRAYIIENRYYTLQTITYKSKSLNAASEKFLDSFELSW